MPARTVLMVEPIGFRANPETAEDNAFQRAAAESTRSVEVRARAEFLRFREAIEAHGIEVVAFRARRGLETPDAVFPNNWFSTHPNETVVFYPMRAASRRLERSAEIVAFLRDRYPRTVDLTCAEERGEFLEGTGSLVIDELSRIVYASLSPRTSRDMVDKWAKSFDYLPVLFSSHDRDERQVYHTNVMMSVGTEVAVVCGEAIDEARDRSTVLDALGESSRQVISISLGQMHAFCANVLELEDSDGTPQLAMSERAYQAFTPEQRGSIERRVEVIHVDLETIETHGGGSARCMLAELY